MRTVAIVSFGRREARGEMRRVASWRQLFQAVGAEVIDVALSPDRKPHLDGIRSVVNGCAAPERLAWSARRLHETLSRTNPTLAVIVTNRAFDPRVLEGSWAILLDHVDSLARSYRDRATAIEGAFRRCGYRTLGAMHRRFERQVRDGQMRRVAAGWVDARALDAEWVPNLVDESLSMVNAPEPDHDLLFVGTLRYPPNVDALERLGRMWPLIQHARPGTSALIAGAEPTPRVRELCTHHGWELLADFASLSHVASHARVAVAPLRHVAGIQNKVLDATCAGLAQVVTPGAIEGFRPGLPLVGHPDDADFVAEILRMLDEPLRRDEQVRGLRDHFEAGYSTAAWAPWARGLLDAVR